MIFELEPLVMSPKEKMEIDILRFIPESRMKTYTKRLLEMANQHIRNPVSDKDSQDSYASDESD